MKKTQNINNAIYILYSMTNSYTKIKNILSKIRS